MSSSRFATTAWIRGNGSRTSFCAGIGAGVRQGTGISLTWDLDGWFVRLARDPGANFTEADMTRLAVGLRF